MTNTKILPFNDDAIAEAARLILEGQVVAIATETVYGLAADATNAAAVARIYEAKGRPAFNPLIVHVEDAAQAEAQCIRFNETAKQLAEMFWPGPLTLVLPICPFTGLASAVTAGLGTAAVRSPAHPAMRRLIELVGRPLAAPSANASGRMSPTRAEHVSASLRGRIPLILDCGPTERGLESTIVKVDGDELVLLRPGPVQPAHVSLYGRLSPPTSKGKIEAPGQLASHYAPSKPLRLNVIDAEQDEYLIGFGSVAGDANLSPSGDLAEAAARLFDLLHLADASPKPRIAVAAVPERGIGAAINDRLRRAAA